MLRTDRFVLRAFVPEDLDAMHALHADPRTNVFNPAGPDTSMEQTRERFDGWLAEWRRYGLGYFAVEEDGRLIGMTGVRRTEWAGLRVFNLGYRFVPEVWGRGVAQECATAAIEAARRQDPQRPVIARTTRDNLPSQRVALGIGLVRAPDLEFDDEYGPTAIFRSGWGRY
ncbi:GNAT family N-acetyltransferase [Microbacteriaceae bacterium VKM Ac-2854]|nr:GNAT family N-acetyltransferase [Microbacteriaceae bacterium VKM Ac-2854]